MTINQKEFSPIFLTLTCFFITCLLISNIIAGKLAVFWGVVLPAAVIIFPLTYLFGDVLTEVYGFERARLVIWIGFGANALMSVTFLIAIALPHPGFWTNQDAYATVLGFTPRLVFASMIAYLAGEFSNSIVLSKVKLLTRGRFLWIRTIGSTAVGQAADTAVFISIAFIGLVPLPVLMGMMMAQYVWKVAYEVIATPLTYVLVGWIKGREGVDAFDYQANYNPFRLEETNETT
ncbi:MAG: queuosine precursor transporter [Deltaproteobacteria bacterium]|nr:queuosine precursor transporter [Deltaproteobacteria bacterium]